MAGDTLTAVQDFDDVRRQTYLDLAFDELVGHRVVVAFNRDVVVDVHARLFPQRELVGLRRQRAQRRTVELFEQLAP